MSSIKYTNADNKAYLKQVVDKSGSKIIQCDQNGKKAVMHEMKK